MRKKDQGRLAHALAPLLIKLNVFVLFYLNSNVVCTDLNSNLTFVLG